MDSKSNSPFDDYPLDSEQDKDDLTQEELAKIKAKIEEGKSTFEVNALNLNEVHLNDGEPKVKRELTEAEIYDQVLASVGLDVIEHTPAPRYIGINWDALEKCGKFHTFFVILSLSFLLLAGVAHWHYLGHQQRVDEGGVQAQHENYHFNHKAEQKQQKIHHKHAFRKFGLEILGNTFMLLLGVLAQHSGKKKSYKLALVYLLLVLGAGMMMVQCLMDVVLMHVYWHDNIHAQAHEQDVGTHTHHARFHHRIGRGHPGTTIAKLLLMMSDSIRALALVSATASIVFIIHGVGTLFDNQEKQLTAIEMSANMEDEKHGEDNEIEVKVVATEE